MVQSAQGRSDSLTMHANLRVLASRNANVRCAKCTRTPVHSSFGVHNDDASERLLRFRRTDGRSVRIAGSYGALAVSSGAGSAHNVSRAVTGVLGRGVASSHISEHDVRVVVAHDRRNQAGWSVQVARLHRQLRADFGTVSLGYAAPRAGTGTGKRALAEAVEALHVGDRVFGAGHLTSYGDARLAAFLL